MAIHQLYAELAKFLVWATVDRFSEGASQAVKGDILHNLCQSTFENACSVLTKLGVAYHDTTLGCERLAVNSDNISQFVMARSVSGQAPFPSIDEVFSAWIWCAEFFGFASPKRVPFAPSNEVQSVFVQLVAEGYAKPVGAAVIWTDKIAAAMRKAGLWNDENVSFAEVAEREIALEAQAALVSIPEDVRHSALRGDVLDVTKALVTRWVDGDWIESDADAPWYALTGLYSDIAHQLVKLIEGADQMADAAKCQQ